jgi:hypothetical protein
MKSTILCLTDFTICSTHVTRQACQLASMLHYHLTILYCYRLNIISSGATLDIKKIKEKEAADKFAILETEVVKDFRIPYEFRAEVGFVTDRVEYHVQRENICFLILEKKMKVGHLEIFEDLLERISVPIILITENEFEGKQQPEKISEPVAPGYR